MVKGKLLELQNEILHDMRMGYRDGPLSNRNAEFILRLIDVLLEDGKSKNECLKVSAGTSMEIVEGLKRYPGRRYMWSPKEIDAIQKSIIHWRDNVSRLKLADGLELEIIRSVGFAMWQVKMPGEVIRVVAIFGASACALCGVYCSKTFICDKCPLCRIGNKCTDTPSAYRNCSEARGNEEIIKAAENMLRVLEGLLE